MTDVIFAFFIWHKNFYTPNFLKDCSEDTTYEAFFFQNSVPMWWHNTVVTGSYSCWHAHAFIGCMLWSVQSWFKCDLVDLVMVYYEVTLWDWMKMLSVSIDSVHAKVILELKLVKVLTCLKNPRSFGVPPEGFESGWKKKIQRKNDKLFWYTTGKC